MQNSEDVQGKNLLSKLYDFADRLLLEVISHPYMTKQKNLNKEQFDFLKKLQADIVNQAVNYMQKNSFKEWEIREIKYLEQYPIPGSEIKVARSIIQFQTIEWISRLKFIAQCREDDNSPILTNLDKLSKLPDISMGTTGGYPDFDPIDLDETLKKVVLQSKKERIVEIWKKYPNLTHQQIAIRAGSKKAFQYLPS